MESLMRLVLSLVLLLMLGIGLTLAQLPPETQTAAPVAYLTTTPSPTWTPFPTQPVLIFSANGRPTEMYSDSYGRFQLYNTSDLDAPLTPDDMNAFDSRVSPDGNRVAYTRREGEGAFAVLVMDTDGANPVRLTDGEHPSWSPDGTQIAFSRADGVYLMDADGGNVEQIRADVNVHELSYTPAGDQLLLVVNDPDAGFLARLLPLDGSSLQPLLPEDPQVSSIAMAPDGETLAWTNSDGLFISPDGGRTANRAMFEGFMSQFVNDEPHTVSDVRWSPDGRYLAFALYSWRLTVAISTPVPVDRVGAQLAIYDTETNQLRVLTYGFENISPDWLPFATSTPAP
jgi:Tol biopolymer transport system component